MKAALEAHPFFRDFLVHVAAGNAAKMGAEAKAPVDAMLAKAAKTGKQTITLSVGKLMTGVTVPQWGAILILRSPEVPGVVLPGRVPGAVAVDDPQRRRHPHHQQAHVLRVRLRPQPGPDAHLPVRHQARRRHRPRPRPPTSSASSSSSCPSSRSTAAGWTRSTSNAVMDWGTAGAGAAMLARRWGSPRLIDLSEAVLTKLLADDDLRRPPRADGGLPQPAPGRQQDHRPLQEAPGRQEASKDGATTTTPRTPRSNAARKAKREQVKTLRDKLLKFVQAVPVFMYLTDFREEALVDVIESLDTQLFERVTGLTLADFHKLSEVGVFHPGHMNEAIWQFRLFERASLDYLGTGRIGLGDKVGMWDHAVSVGELPVK